MAVYINQPMFPVDFLRPTRASFDNPGSGFDGGVGGTGQGISIETAGGGHVTATYEGLFIEGPGEQHEVMNWLGAYLNGGFRFINVSVVNDKIGPFPVIDGVRRPIIKGIQHSDGSFFADSAGYSQSTVWAKLTADAALNAGQIYIRIYGAARDLRWSDWMSINHTTKGWRAFRNWDSEKLDEGTETVSGVSWSFKDYRLAITPPLREAAASGTRIEVARPTCVMKLPTKATVPWDYSGFYSSRPSLSFVEAF